MSPNLPVAERRYLRAVVDRLLGVLAGRLVAVYLFGSGSYGDYRAAADGELPASDLDVQAVVEGPLAPSDRDAVVDRLRHRNLPCPARRLEFVCYQRTDLSPVARRPRFSVDLNTGPEIVDFVCTNPDDEPSHWFLLDLAIGRELGRSLLGPPPAEMIAPIPRAWQLGAIRDSLAWHGGAEPASANRRLNAARGWRFAETGQWGSKQAGAAWAREHQPGVDDVAVADLDATVRRCVEAALVRELRASGTVGHPDVTEQSPGWAGG